MKFVDDEGDTQALALVRIGLALLLIWQGFDRLSEGYFGDRFFWPWVAWVPSAGVYRALLFVELAGAALALVGLRAGLLVSGGTGIYLLLCDRLQFHHNRYCLFLFAILISLAPCDRVLTPFSRGRERRAPLWAQRLAQLQVSLIYLASGGSKLLDADWRGGLMLAARVGRHFEEAAHRGIPRALLTFLLRPEIASLVAKGAISVEIGLAIFLWSRRWHAAALYVGAGFHFLIEGTSNVERFSWLMWLLYALFASTEIRTRTLRCDRTRALDRFVARTVGGLDWLLRFQIEEGPLEIVQPDGTIARGAALPGALARALPLLFPLWPILQLGGAISVRFFPLRGRSASSAAR